MLGPSLSLLLFPQSRKLDVQTDEKGDDDDGDDDSDGHYGFRQTPRRSNGATEHPGVVGSGTGGGTVDACRSGCLCRGFGRSDDCASGGDDRCSTLDNGRAQLFLGRVQLKRRSQRDVTQEPRLIRVHDRQVDGCLGRVVPPLGIELTGIVFPLGVFNSGKGMKQPLGRGVEVQIDRGGCGKACSVPFEGDVGRGRDVGALSGEEVQVAVGQVACRCEKASAPSSQQVEPTYLASQQRVYVRPLDRRETWKYRVRSW